MRYVVQSLVVLSLAIVAGTSQAGADFYRATGQLTCFGVPSDKLEKEVFKSNDLISTALDTSPANAENFTLIYSAAGNVWRIVNRCTGAGGGQISENVSCAIAEQSNKEQGACTHALEFPGVTSDGRMMCQYKRSGDSLQKVSGTCTGNIDINNVPCIITLKIGKLFGLDDDCDT